MINIFYRLSVSDKPETRPNWFSKELCFKSFLLSLSRIKLYNLKIIVDGNFDLFNIKKIMSDLNICGNIENISIKENSGSFLYSIEKSFNLNSNDMVYFSEDDYLYTSEAFKKLENLLKENFYDYITLYDHPVRYASIYKFGLDIPNKKETIFISENHHWRTQESTCMTFASKVKTLKEDFHIFKIYLKDKVPQDRYLFRKLQGLKDYEDNSPNRILIGPIPSLITHCHKDWLAPIVNWEFIVKNINYINLSYILDNLQF